MYHEKFKVVASVENVEVVYNAFFYCFFEAFFRDIE
jgi:hypothetical protein